MDRFLLIVILSFVSTAFASEPEEMRCAALAKHSVNTVFFINESNPKVVARAVKSRYSASREVESFTFEFFDLEEEFSLGIEYAISMQRHGHGDCKVKKIQVVSDGI